MDITKLNRIALSAGIASINALDIEQWVFDDGMLFHAKIKWWGAMGVRAIKHNGLDIVSYRDGSDAISTLQAGTKIPLILAGRVVRVVPDFIGHSIFVAHESIVSGARRYTIYGHVLPVEGIIGWHLGAGEIIATLAGTKNDVPPHLHVSVAMVPEDIDANDLSWKMLDSRDDVIFIDPSGIVD